MGHLPLKIQMIVGKDIRKERIARLNKSKKVEDKKDSCMVKSKRRMTRFSKR